MVVNLFYAKRNLWYSCKGRSVERTQSFHQDYDGLNFLKVFIYLSDVTEYTGPHRYISGSINNIKEPQNYQPSTRLSNAYAKAVYGNKIKTFTGKKGTIIICNTNGFHAGTPIFKDNRFNVTVTILFYGITFTTRMPILQIY